MGILQTINGSLHLVQVIFNFSLFLKIYENYQIWSVLYMAKGNLENCLQTQIKHPIYKTTKLINLYEQSRILYISCKK
jgi:hypothetical protein